MPNSTATTAAHKRIACVASAAVLTAVTIAAALALTFPTYSWAEESTTNEDESPVKLVQQERGVVDGVSQLVSLDLTDDLILPAEGGPSIVEAAGNLDDWGMPTSGAFVDMVINAKCVDSTASAGYYARILVAVPSAFERLDASSSSATNSPLHLVDGSDFRHYNINWSDLWTHEVDQSNPIAINGVTYNLHVYTYKQVLKSDEATQLPAIVGFYLDPSVDYDHNTGTLTMAGATTGQPLLGGTGISIPVSAQCVATTSSNGTPYASAEAAFSAQNPTLNPWAESSILGKLIDKLMKGLGIG